MSKTNTSDRVMFTQTTSEVFGSFTKSDLETHLSLIRRKVQEKCGSIQELMAQVRRTKVGEGNSVTPVEFRYTLAKFGIIMSQAEVTRVFNVFDSDRSGTMDFDEFAMWIMNSEFQPKAPVVQEGPTYPEILHSKFANCVKLFPDYFKLLKRNVTFMELICDMVVRKMPMKDNEIRDAFNIVDVAGIGSVESDRLLGWARSGKVPPRKASTRPTSVPDLKSALVGMVGQSFDLISESFKHIRRGTNELVDYDEFRRALIATSAGSEEKKIERLWRSLGGKSGGNSKINIDLLLDNTPVAISAS